MEPLNENELDELLRMWQAPHVPASLNTKVLGRASRLSWWRWLLSGTIRVPVPAGVLAIAIVMFSVYWAVSSRWTAEKPGQTVTLSDFQPVKQLQPRIIRSGYEGQ